jgi:hypothetical protein
MKKFVFLYVGFDPSWMQDESKTNEIKQAWGRWFASVGDKFIDSGNPLMPGKEVTADSTNDLPHDKNAIVGYSILKAANLDEAVKIAQTCPMITSIKVYETGSM